MSANEFVKELGSNNFFMGEGNEFGLQYDIACGFPINSIFVVLVSPRRRKLIIYNVMSWFVYELLAHPLR